MPRRARQKSESGIYHIILRGINRQNIFEDEEDNYRFLQTLMHYTEISGYELYAYCLMGNHVHLLLRVDKEPLEQILRRVCGSYVYWYNRKYERIGNLFQDRFKSEPVEDDPYFLTVLRYIHQNPFKANLVERNGEYKWSSYSAYMSGAMNKSKLVDLDFTLKLFDKDQNRAVKAFREFHNQVNDDDCLDIDDRYRITDQEAGEIIKSRFNLKSCQDMQKLDRKKRDASIKQLKEKYNLSIRQIERLTGINRGIISRV